MSASDFFKNNDGTVVVVQPPNLLISVWVVLQVIQIFIPGNEPKLQVLSTAALFAWAYLELTQGESPFRKALGAVVLLFIVVTVFLR